MAYYSYYPQQAPYYSHYPQQVPINPYCSLEMSVLFSGRNSSSGSNLENEIVRLEEKLTEYETKLEDAVGRLEDSLNQAGLTKSNRRTPDPKDEVAEAIKNYMKNKQDGWECDSHVSNGNFIIHYSYFFDILREALLPQAEADTKGSIGSTGPLVGNDAPVPGVEPQPEPQPDPQPVFVPAAPVSPQVQPCKKSLWKSSTNFKNKGKVNVAFCGEENHHGTKYATNKGECQRAIQSIARILKLMEETDKKMHEKRMKTIEVGDNEEETEAGGLCFDCLEELRDLYKPTGWQKFGNIASIIGGVGLSYLGVKEGRKARREVNELRAWQGLEAENNLGYSLAGLGMGFPFISRGVYGLRNSRPNCGSTLNSYRGYAW